MERAVARLWLPCQRSHQQPFSKAFSLLFHSLFTLLCHPTFLLFSLLSFTFLVFYYAVVVSETESCCVLQARWEFTT